MNMGSHGGLPPRFTYLADRDGRSCDLLLVLGTSLKAGMISQALQGWLHVCLCVNLCCSLKYLSKTYVMP